MNYWFLYEVATGKITQMHENSAEEWTNIPDGYGVIGPFPKNNETAVEAFERSNYYTVQNKMFASVLNIDELRAADRAPKPVPVSEIDEVKQQIADINLVLADMMGA